MAEVIHTSSGVGAPASTPTSLGMHYTDTQNKDTYLSVGTSSPADWKKLRTGDDPTPPEKAASADIVEGEDDQKYVTSKGLRDAGILPGGGGGDDGGIGEILSISANGPTGDGGMLKAYTKANPLVPVSIPLDPAFLPMTVGYDEANDLFVVQGALRHVWLEESSQKILLSRSLFRIEGATGKLVDSTIAEPDSEEFQYGPMVHVTSPYTGTVFIQRYGDLGAWVLEDGIYSYLTMWGKSLGSDSRHAGYLESTQQDLISDWAWKGSGYAWELYGHSSSAPEGLELKYSSTGNDKGVVSPDGTTVVLGTTSSASSMTTIAGEVPVSGWPGYVGEPYAWGSGTIILYDSGAEEYKAYADTSPYALKYSYPSNLEDMYISKIRGLTADRTKLLVEYSQSDGSGFLLEIVDMATGTVLHTYPAKEGGHELGRIAYRTLDMLP